jgi:hypothetical protein
MGMPDKEVRLLAPADFNAVRSEGAYDPMGEYLDKSDLIIIKRDVTELSPESLNGPEVIESFIIHEFAHSKMRLLPIGVDVSTRKRVLRRAVTVVNVNTLRAGSIVVKENAPEEAQGFYLEEAGAEYERGLYVVNELGRPRGFTSGLQPDGEPTILDKYTYLQTDDDGNITIEAPVGAIPAATLELMINHDPKLLDALREAPRSVKGLRERARRINAISPGLYPEMRKLDIRAQGGQTKAKKLYYKVKKLLAKN